MSLSLSYTVIGVSIVGVTVTTVAVSTQQLWENVRRAQRSVMIAL